MKLRVNVLLLFSFVILYVPAVATTYYFSTSGSDANNGLSSSTPKQSMSVANQLMGGGNIILFKRGDTWYLPQSTIMLDNRSNFTLDAYGSGNRPVIAGLALINDTWTYEGDFIWSNPTVYSDALRVFVDDISRISLDDKANNSPVLADLNTSDEYWYDKATRKLYIYHTSATDAPENVVMLPAWPAPSLVNMLNTTNVTLRNIEFSGGGNIATIRINAPSSNILIDDCMITRSNLMGIFAINNQQNMNVVENLVIQNCIIDKSWTQAENNLKPEVFLDGDGVSFMHGVKNSVVKNCKITNWGHDGISVIATEFTTGIYGVKFNKFEGNDISAGNSAYMHAFGISGFKNLAMYNIFKRNYCHGFSSANSIGGNTNFVFSNIFANVEVSPLLQHSQAPHAINLATWTIKDKNGVSGSMECKNNWIVNNTIYNTDTYSFRVDRSNTDGDVTTLMDNKIYNNLMLNYGLDTTFVLDPQNTTAPVRMGMRILTNVSAGVTFIRNNNFWAEWDTTGSRPVALYHRRFYNAEQLTDCLECGPGMVSGNTQTSPYFGKFYSLTSTSSELLRAGGYSYVPGIVAEGLPSAELVDYNGEPWPNSDISVGAIQYNGIGHNEGVDTTYYRDADGDTFGDANNSIVASRAPEGYVTNSDDFDDTDATLYPGALEVCNGKDENGNGQIDEGVQTTYYKDADGDTYGDPGTSTAACSVPDGYVTNHDDFDDSDAGIYPGATEVCNGKDDDGNGQIDEGVMTTYYRDADGDTYGDPNNSTAACSVPEGYVTNDEDFDDTDETLHPGATEVCNGKDDNGNGQIDEGVTTTYYLDDDGDGYGSSVTINACAAPAKYVTNNTDCDDNSSSVHPNATELCNGIDDDCDGQIDEGVKTTFYFDKDGDGYGDSNVQLQACAAPGGYVSNSSDCNDNSGAVNPGATEICGNGIDDNCNGVLDEGCIAVTLPKISINGPNVWENNTGVRDASFKLTLDKVSAVPITVRFATASNTATTADYVPTSGTVTFPANTLTATLNVGVQGDLIDEIDESFHVILSSPTNATILKGTGIGVILDDDAVPTMVIADTSTNEALGVAVVRVSLSLISGKTVTVKYNTKNGTATAPGDYTAQSNGTVSFAPGVKHKYINIVVKKDGANEPTEKFTVILKQAVSATIAKSTSTVTLNNSSIIVTKTAVLDTQVLSDEPLTMTASPNPSTNEFTLFLKGGEGPLTVRVLDMLGRPVEIRSAVQPNSNIQLGGSWRGGTYIVEVFNKEEKATLKLLKIN